MDMLSKIDDFLNTITMYRLTMLCLFFLWFTGLFLSFFGLMPFDPIPLIISFIILLGTCFFINKIFAYIYQAPFNTESTYITAFILSLIAGPENSWRGFLSLFFIGVLAVLSKYLLAINKKHIFNPAAFAIAGAYVFNYYASWWIGVSYMLPFVLIAGFLIVRKLQRTDLVTSFLTVFLVFSLGKNIFDWQHIFLSVKNIFAYSPVLFFSFVMLTEPMTTPPVKKLRIIYGVLVAFLLAPFAHIYSFYFSPEFALLIGNIFSYAISPKQKLLLKLKEKNIIANNTIQFAFDLQTKLKFLPGQYLEWTLSHQKQDQRGMRRYFTIASSPTEEDIKLCVKFYELASSYKKRLKNLPIGSDIVASQLAGEFTMPNDKNKKLVFIAGGIGITPFRSMIKYLIDINEKRDIIIFYTNNSFSDIVYKEIFKEAEKKLGIKTVYILNHLHGVPIDFNCNVGLITKEVIIEKAPDYQERTYYISGPRSMIVSFEKTLNEIGITKSNIKTDFFPGFA